jgi:hypothetical protein
MLNKDVCRACAECAARRGMSTEEAQAVFKWTTGEGAFPEKHGWWTWPRWDEADEARWEHDGLVFCRYIPNEKGRRLYPTDGLPPSWCMCAAEQVMSQEAL